MYGRRHPQSELGGQFTYSKNNATPFVNGYTGNGYIKNQNINRQFDVLYF